MINKQRYIKDLEKMVSERSSDCEVYFTTITFKHMKKTFDYECYEEFFHFFRQKLDNVLMCNSTQYHKRPVLFLIPEDVPALHFHGFIFIHKDTDQKFFKQCVDAVTEEYVEKLDRDKFSLHLNERLSKPYPKARYKQFLQTLLIQNKKGNLNRAERELMRTKKPMLWVKSINMYPINTDNEYKGSSIYCMKKFSMTNENLERVIIETKDKRFHEDVFFLSRRLVSSGDNVTIERIIKRYLFQLAVLHQIRDASILLSMINSISKTTI